MQTPTPLDAADVSGAGPTVSAFHEDGEGGEGDGDSGNASRGLRAVPTEKPIDRSAYNTLDSPFLDLDSPFTPWEALKMAMLLPLVVPRVLLCVIAMMCLAACSYIAASGCDLTQPLPRWRRRLVLFASCFARVVLWALGYRLTWRGLDNIRRGADVRAMIVFNHAAFADSAIMMYMFAPSGVAKATLTQIPLLGTCISAYQNIYVPRQTDDRGMSDSKKAAFRLANKLNGLPGDLPIKSVTEMIAKRAKDARFPPVCISPEGTCGNGRCLLQFRTGAFIPGLPVLPVILKYNWRHFNTAWTNIDERWHTVRMLCQFVNHVEVEVLPPYIPSPAEQADPALYAANVRKVYAAVSGLPLSGHSQIEFLALLKAGVGVSWDGRRVTAPPNVVSPTGLIDLRPYIRPKKGRPDLAKLA